MLGMIGDLEIKVEVEIEKPHCIGIHLNKDYIVLKALSGIRYGRHS